MVRALRMPCAKPGPCHKAGPGGGQQCYREGVAFVIWSRRRSVSVTGGAISLSDAGKRAPTLQISAVIAWRLRYTRCAMAFFTPSDWEAWRRSIGSPHVRALARRGERLMSFVNNYIEKNIPPGWKAFGSSSKSPQDEIYDQLFVLMMLECKWPGKPKEANNNTGGGGRRDRESTKAVKPARAETWEDTTPSRSVTPSTTSPAGCGRCRRRTPWCRHKGGNRRACPRCPRPVFSFCRRRLE